MCAYGAVDLSAQASPVIFDRLCGVVERHYRALRKPLREAHLFAFPGRAHETLPKFFSDEGLGANDVRFLTDSFFLPFPCVAIEDTASCIVLWDDEGDEREGVYRRRFFVEGMRVGVGPEEFADSKSLPKRACQDPDLMAVSIGWLRGLAVDPDPPHKMTYEGGVEVAFAANKRQVLANVSGPDRAVPRLLSTAGVRNAWAAVEEIIYFNTPSRFVVERCATRVEKRLNVIPRSDARSVFDLMTPIEINQRLRLGELVEGASNGRSKPKPHHRRRHYRVLRSERYKAARGKRITVPAVWVGPSEGCHAGRTYKVRLDL